MYSMHFFLQIYKHAKYIKPKLDTGLNFSFIPWKILYLHISSVVPTECWSTQIKPKLIGNNTQEFLKYQMYKLRNASNVVSSVVL